MSSSDIHFVDRTDAALADAELQLALDRAMARFRLMRTSAIERTIDMGGLRDRARAIRAECGTRWPSFSR